MLTVEAGRDRDARRIIADAGNGLVRYGLPMLASFRLASSATGDWLAASRRGARAAETYSVPRPAGGPVSTAVSELTHRTAEAVGGDDDRVWWQRCAERLGRGAVDQGLALLKEAGQSGRVTNPRGLLTKFFKDIAASSCVALT